MGRFKPAPFGNADINTVKNELQISGSVVIVPGDTVTTSTTALDTNTSITFIDSDGAGSITIGLPAPGTVPVGWTMTLKDIGPLGIGDSVRIRGAAAGQNIDGETAIFLRTAWESIILMNTGVAPGTTWLIVGYFNGVAPT